ncbi:MAG: hypothetical protein KAW12_23820 [Candidatus Aminicenantes bacterium]|nr:hypothetical protein [Candidatus Aminicenantes bacterium]
MKKYFVFISIAVFFMNLFIGCSAETLRIRRAKARVNVILNGISRGADDNPKNEQIAVCRWWRDVALLTDINEFGSAGNAFDKWRLALDIYPVIDSYTIEDAEIDTEAKHPTVIVYVTINRMDYTLRVPEKGTIGCDDIF